jgi:hypothetical protein
LLIKIIGQGDSSEKTFPLHQNNFPDSKLKQNMSETKLTKQQAKTSFWVIVPFLLFILVSGIIAQEKKLNEKKSMTKVDELEQCYHKCTAQEYFEFEKQLEKEKSETETAIKVSEKIKKN